MAAIELNVTSIGRINSISDTSLNNTYAVVYNSSTGTPMGFEMDIIVDMDASLVAAHADIAANELGLSNEATTRGNADNALDEKIKNVTTGHDHDGTDSKKVDHANLENKGINTHTQIDAHISSTTNPHGVTKTQVGLGDVDNTSDVNKPVSTAQQAALDLKVDKVAGKGLSANDYDATEKAAVANSVRKTGDETISGVKTFSASPIVPAPTADLQASTKKYVDDADALKVDKTAIANDLTTEAEGKVLDARQAKVLDDKKVDKVTGKGLSANDYDATEKAAVANSVRKTGDETISGVKTFSASPIIPAPTTNLQASTKKYVDDAAALKVDKTAIANDLATTAEGKVLDARQGKELDDKKVDKVAGKGLSTNDYTNEEKAEVAKIVTIEGNLNDITELTTAEAIAVLFKELAGVKALLAKMVTGEAWVDKLLVMSELNLFGETNMILKATAAPVPDFVGQFFVNTSTSVTYQATGTSSVSDWKQITN